MPIKTQETHARPDSFVVKGEVRRREEKRREGRSERADIKSSLLCWLGF